MSEMKETEAKRPIMPDAGADNRPLVELTHVEKHYGDLHVLKDINLTVRKGEVLVIVGPSGSGKSTMCRTINRLETIDSGDIRIDGKPLPQEGKELAKLRAEVGMVFQSFNLFANKTILENVTLAPIKVRHMDKKEARELAIEELNRVGMGERLDYYPAQLSGGQQQRVAIAGVVAMRPDCLILDEATAMLDPRGREQVMQTIHYLNRNMGITVVSITHYMEEAAQADRVLVMSKGHVVMEGTPKEVFSQTEKVRSLHLDVPQAAELRDELVKAGIPMPEGIIDTGACAQALYELLQ